jgi:hypothetical protein
MAANGQKKTGKVRLTPAQVEAAKASNMTPAEYAKQAIRLVEAGELPPTAIQYVN